MKTNLYFLSLLCCISSVSLSAQTTDANRRTAMAIRVEKAPHLDGDLDDACWKNAPITKDFTTNAPTFGLPAAEQTEVRIIYTDEAIYVGAHLQMRDAAKIRTDLSRRDAQSTADQFHIAFDTYHDRQNAFRFEVSASGVQRDLRMSPNAADPNWDAVWDAKVKVHTDGWVAEMRIPFSAIRFAKGAEQVWGFQMARQIQYANEFSTWSPVDPNGGGALPQWGDLKGLQDLHPPLRLSLSPYVAGSVQRTPAQLQKPTDYYNSRSINGGMDVKWGISEGFTLDATLVPNFGEAQSDNRVRNLSPFEVQYEERRPFFTEGTELFSKGDLFYSRRIGGTPRRFFAAANSLGPDEVLRKNPSQQQLYNATKLSGRTKSKLGIGMLNAVAAPSNALIVNELTGEERKVSTGELTNYNVIVLDQALPNNSAISFVNTNVLREGNARDANVSALLFNLREPKNRYGIYGQARLSQVFAPGGDAAPAGGYTFGIEKVSGSWTWEFNQSSLDNRYDQRDMGIYSRNNFFSQFGRVSYANYEPKGKLLSSFAQLWVENTSLYAPRKWESTEVRGYTEIQTVRRHSFSLFMLTQPVWYYDFFEPRVEGRQFHHAPFVYFQPSFTTDARKKLQCTFALQFGESPIPHDPYIGLQASPRWIANNHLIVRGDFNLSKDHSNFGAVDWSDANDIVFGRRNITSFDNQISAEYLFSPRMNASIRARHYWAKIVYNDYLHLNDDGSLSPSDFTGNADENFNLLNIDFVYTWQFAPGSFLNLIWKDAIFQGDQARRDDFLPNFRKTIHAPQDNTLTLKLIYYLDAGSVM